MGTPFGTPEVKLHTKGHTGHSQLGKPNQMCDFLAAASMWLSSHFGTFDAWLWGELECSTYEQYDEHLCLFTD
jgi:hypothetical protein